MRPSFPRSGRPVNRTWLSLLLLALLIATPALVPLGAGAENPAEERPELRSTTPLFSTPPTEMLSGIARSAALGTDPRWAGRLPQGVQFAGADHLLAGGDRVLAAGGGSGGGQGAVNQQVPFRNPAPAFSRNIMVTRAVGNYPYNTEPHIAVDPTDPEHLVLGTIDFNLNNVASYVSFDGGETWDGPRQTRVFREDFGFGGDPVVGFDRDGVVYMAQLSLGAEEFTIGNIRSFALVSSIVVNRSFDGGLTWEDGVPSARSRITTTSNIDDAGKERGTITTGFLDKEWMTVGPDPEDPSKDIIHVTYTDFQETSGLLYADEVPYLSNVSLETTIRSVSSRDGGITWSEPVAVSPSVTFNEGAFAEEEGPVGEGATGGATNLRQLNAMFGAEALPAPAQGGARALPAAQVDQAQEGVLESRRFVQGSQPKVLSDGTVVVAYFDSTNDGAQEGLGTIFVAFSRDGGRTFEEPRQVEVYRELHDPARSAGFRYNGSQFPQLAVGPNDEIYYVHGALSLDRATDDGDIILGASLDKGATWEPTVRVNQDDTPRLQFLPTLSVSPDGILHLMWGDMRDDPQEIRYHVYYTKSEDQGKTFGFTLPDQDFTAPDTRVTDYHLSSLRVCAGCAPEVGDYWASAANEDDVFLTWVDTRLGEFGGFNVQIGFARQTAMQPPSLFLNPPSGSAGRVVDIQGFGYQPNSNIILLVSGVIVANPRTDDQGQFQTSIYMPLTGEGPTAITAADETGNVATASFFTEFGFDTLQESLEAINQQMGIENQGATPGAEASPVASPVSGDGTTGGTGGGSPPDTDPIGTPGPLIGPTGGSDFERAWSAAGPAPRPFGPRGRNEAQNAPGDDPMSHLSTLLVELTSGALTRRQFVARASALGLSAPLVATLAAQPEAVFAQEATPPTGGDSGERPGPAADVVTFSAYNVDQAPLNIRNGDIDLYVFSLKTAGAQDLEGAGDVSLIQAPASTLSLILNPAPGNEGELNPFSIVEIRRAMQYLVDREFIANDIYQGRALPMLTNVSPLDYDQLTVFPVTSVANIRHDAEFAKSQITTAMEAAGAQLGGDGKWSFNGNPITLTIVTRVEDERRDIGDTVRAALEGLGFQVAPQYQQFGPATLAVYASDPKLFQWHIYTEGWGRGAANRYDDAGINQFAAPWLGNMPGWQELGFWQYENADLDDLGKKLYRGEFNSREERDQLYQQMSQLALDESVRIWLVTALQSFPVRNEVENLTVDLVSGPKNLFALRGASIPGRNDIKVGNLWVWTERTTWNPVGGFGDVYSTDIRRNLVDPPLINDPFTGIPEPFRAGYTVETAGPDGTLEVPAEAVVWDAVNDAWVPVAAGTTAVSKVVFDYARFVQSSWHHGPAITMADVVYPIAQAFEIAFDEAKIQIETAIGITSRPLLETYKGFRVTGETTLEVYVDYWHFEQGYIASYASPSGVATPWELLAAMDDAVYEKRQAAYTDTSAARFNVPWLSLVTESDARLVLRSLREFGRRNAIPAGVFEMGGEPLVSEEEAGARYDACIAWFEQTNHLMIGNGPFQLTRYDPPAQFAQLDAFRADGYPFTAADFQLGTPPSLSIDPVPPPALNLGDPISLQVQVNGPGALALQYTLIDPAAGTAVATGAGEGGDGGLFTVNVDPNATAALFPGIYQLFLLASSDELSQVAQQRIDLQIGV